MNDLFYTVYAAVITFILGYAYFFNAGLLMGASIGKHLSLQNSAVKDSSDPYRQNVFIGIWMMISAIPIFLIFPDIVILDLKNLSWATLSIALGKGVLVLAIVYANQILAGDKKFDAYALSKLICIAPLAFVNHFTGESLDSLGYLSAFGLSFFGFIFFFSGEMKKAPWKVRLSYIVAALIGSTPAMTDNIVKMDGMHWQTSWILSNLTLMSVALLISIRQGKIKKHLHMTFNNKDSLKVAFFWVFSEFVILWTMFTQMDVSVTEMTRNLYIPLTQVISIYLFTKASVEKVRVKALKSMGLGAVAYAIATPMMVSNSFPHATWQDLPFHILTYTAFFAVLCFVCIGLVKLYLHHKSKKTLTA